MLDSHTAPALSRLCVIFFYQHPLLSIKQVIEINMKRDKMDLLKDQDEQVIDKSNYQAK